MTLTAAGVEMTRYTVQLHTVHLRITNHRIQSRTELLPPCRNAHQCPYPVRDAEQIHSHLERVRLESQCGERHVSAVAAADYSDPLWIDHACCDKQVFAGDNVAEVSLAVPAVVHLVKCFSIARAAAIVDVEDEITVIDEPLGERGIADLCLTARSSMHQYESRRFVL